jgi:hypothetical protein
MCYRLGEMDDSLHTYKMRFAQALQRYARDKRNAYACAVARQVVGRDAEKYPMYVIKIAEEWPLDPDVIAEMDRLDLIPVPREVVLNDIYAIASDPYKETKDKLQALRLYAEVNGWIQKSVSRDTGNSNELLTHLQALHNAVSNPVET